MRLAILVRQRFFSALVAGMLLLAYAGSTNVWADEPESPTATNNTTLPLVVVTATRSPRSSFEVPASIDSVRVDPTTTLAVNPSEYMQAIPGLVARDRQNYAQDEQISIRGFGARSTFGVRGVRLYTDGIPATMPDGQGQVSNFGLGSADRIEILRGPFSALYGNSSGGVIQIFTADGTAQPMLSFDVDSGSYGTSRADIDARGCSGILNYNVDVSHFYTDGYRGHGSAQRENGNAKFGIDLGQGRKLTLILNTVALPNADDPLGLTRAQFNSDPRLATSVAFQFDTRKSVHQEHGGAIYEQPLGDNQSLRIMGYFGNRNVQQFQSIPIATQLRPTSPGGVIDLNANYGGTDTRWTYNGALAGKPFDLAAGFSYDRENQRRYGYNNYDGTRLGVQGALRRDEQDDVFNFDEYVQATWSIADRWLLSAGARHSKVTFSSVDNFITATNPDRSSGADYSATTPVAGLMFRATDRWHLYTSYGNGFETPTFNELGYRPDGSAGINLGLIPARSHNSELGSKWLIGDGGEFNIDLFRADTRHELAVDNSTGGRTTYQNIDSARRQGAELKFDYPIADSWRAQIAYTLLDAKFTSPFLTCPAAATCVVANTVVAAGARIPGVPRSDFYAALRYGARDGWNGVIECAAATNTAVNDLNTQVAPGYAVMNIGAGYSYEINNTQISTFLRLNNIFDKSYSGSVIVNESNGRYYEPAPARTIFAGIHIDWKY